MKPFEKDELFQHLSDFLKNKGVELKEGSYARTIQKSCGLLADAINLGQKGFGRAKVEIDRKLDQMRQVIHEKTAPKASPKARSAASSSPSESHRNPKSSRARRSASSRAKPSPERK